MQKDVIFTHLVGHVKRNLAGLFDASPDITDEMFFVDLGASSCDRAVIAADMLDSLSIKMPVEDILVASTIGEMVELIYNGATSNS